MAFPSSSRCVRILSRAIAIYRLLVTTIEGSATDFGKAMNIPFKRLRDRALKFLYERFACEQI